MTVSRPLGLPTVSKAKTLCDWSKKDIRERWEELSELVAAPKYACTKCGRSASQKAVLCKPRPLARDQAPAS